ncbi:MAG: hypothetical protein AAGF12_27175 [Myxococcota bacterium]
MLVRLASALEVSADELLGLQAPGTPRGITNNRRLLRRLKRIEELPKRDQDALIRTIDAFLGKQKAG